MMKRKSPKQVNVLFQSFFFHVNLSSVLLKFLLPDGVFFQGKLVPQHLILSISSESCLKIRWLTISGKR